MVNAANIAKATSALAHVILIVRRQIEQTCAGRVPVGIVANGTNARPSSPAS
ncbi:hypothetical protein VD0002_g178 [Verticillium dahliae]|uniref:Uncharacterized protein n=1 Tax=Verticillium dahliae TaxID=27337 RepID=A0AA44WPY2_VERDA|nr:hypothetical protein BJF96_g1228 [Verticillium dahliae]PNH48462.1 hypothetical protein VD0004_g89 [Verticillium dahliae]PNH57445.1 hypothetical protein VD0003_g439 [Verticillium dahliae]PNH70517.1 hypothetical protein VD0002_g178 [Verticillium dahliae]